ncbi:MAG TPA: hypothetical protein VGD45_20485 [Steroidobacter sp.]|uniref:hypothetical protein n=1 Tax=Steroidobacter sp. TaxID=1978227 RepID=UPI002EDAEC45
MSDVHRETNNPQLLWKLVSDMRKVSMCGRYVIDREPHYDNFPAMDYRYVAKRLDLQANPIDTCKSFDLAAAACERHLSAQPQPKGK